MIAGPLCCTLLADFGADVIKIEHPDQGDTMRKRPPEKDGKSLWWKVIARNKREWCSLALALIARRAGHRRVARATGRSQQPARGGARPARRGGGSVRTRRGD